MKRAQRSSLIVLLVAASVLAVAIAAAEAAPTTIDFEALTGPSHLPFEEDPPLIIGNATFSGGAVLTAKSGLTANQTTVYATSRFCFCSSVLTIGFVQPVSGFSVDVYNDAGTGIAPETPEYVVQADTGGEVAKVLEFEGPRSFATFSLPDSGIRRVTISSNTRQFDFAIDNVRFTPLQGRELRSSGGTRRLPDGDVILLDESGRGHRLRAHPAIAAQLAAYAGRTMTVRGVAVEDPATEPHYPILVQDFRLEPGGAFDGQHVRVFGVPIRLPDGAVVIYDSLGHGHRLRALFGDPAEIDRAVGKRVQVDGWADVTNTASRLTWPIDVRSFVELP